VETDPIRVCELIVGLPDVNVLGVEDLGAGRLCGCISSVVDPVLFVRSAGRRRR
jgi:hypothetical protein